MNIFSKLAIILSLCGFCPASLAQTYEANYQMTVNHTKTYNLKNIKDSKAISGYKDLLEQEKVKNIQVSDKDTAMLSFILEMLPLNITADVQVLVNENYLHFKVSNLQSGIEHLSLRQAPQENNEIIFDLKQGICYFPLSKKFKKYRMCKIEGKPDTRLGGLFIYQNCEMFGQNPKQKITLNKDLPTCLTPFPLEVKTKRFRGGVERVKSNRMSLKLVNHQLTNEALNYRALFASNEAQNTTDYFNFME